MIAHSGFRDGSSAWAPAYVGKTLCLRRLVTPSGEPFVGGVSRGGNEVVPAAPLPPHMRRGSRNAIRGCMTLSELAAARLCHPEQQQHRRFERARARPFGTWGRGRRYRIGGQLWRSWLAVKRWAPELDGLGLPVWADKLLLLCDDEEELQLRVDDVQALLAEPGLDFSDSSLEWLGNPAFEAPSQFVFRRTNQELCRVGQMRVLETRSV